MSSVTIEEAQSGLQRLIERAAAGEDVVIVEDGKQLARITPIIDRATSRRVPGDLGGRVFEAPGCWDPEPESTGHFASSAIFPESGDPA